MKCEFSNFLPVCTLPLLMKATLVKFMHGVNLATFTDFLRLDLSFESIRYLPV